MKRLLLLSIVQCLMFCIYAQTTVETALPFKEGTNLFTFESPTGQNTVYYVYTAPAEQSKLLTVQTATSSINVMLSEDGTYNTRINGASDGNGTINIFPVKKGQKVYLSVGVYNTSEVNFTTTLKDVDIDRGATCETAITATKEEFFVPSYYDTKTYQNYPTFLSYPCTENGLLEMTFSGYLSAAKIRVGCDGTNTDLTPTSVNSKYIAKYAVEAGKNYIIELGSYSPMMASFNISHPVEGASCDMPFLGKESNVLPKATGKYWYQYSAYKAGFMVISSESDFPGGNISLYRGCSDYSPFASINGYFAIRCKVDAGTSYLICIEKTEETDVDETFNIIVEDPKAGDLFESPIDIEIGTHTVPQYDGIYYYKLIVPEGDSRFLIVDAKSANLQNSNSSVKLFAIDNSYSPIAQGKDYLKSEVAGGQSYILAWNCGEGFNVFDFTTSYEEIAQGDVCSNPIMAKDGQNDLAAGTVKYYKYTATKNGWLKIDTDIMIGVGFPRSCQGQAEYNSVKIGAITKMEIVTGVEYLIKFTNIGQATRFTLSEEEYKEGESCDLAIPVNVGATAIPEEILNYWYQYTATQDGMVTISSDIIYEQSSDYYKYSSVSVKVGDCSVYPVSITQTNSEGTWFEGKFVVQKGDVLYINVVTYSAQIGKNLNIAVRDLNPGESCSKPIPLTSGSVTFPESSRSLPIWYSINLQPGEFDVTSVNPYTLYLYKACGDETPLTQSEYKYDPTGSASEYKLHYKVEANGIYVLKLEMSYANTVVNVSGSAIVTIVQGDLCSDPLLAKVGENELATGTAKYYKYTTTKNGWLKIAADTNIGVNFLKGCEGEGEYEAVKAGTITKMEVTSGTAYLIKFSNIEEATHFTLSEEEYKEGEKCDRAIVISEANTALPQEILNHWYQYSASQDGMLTISSDIIFEQNSDTQKVSFVSVKMGDCSADPVNITHTNAGVTRFEGKFIVSKDDILYINIVTCTAQTGKKLTVAIRDLQPGETCSLPLTLPSGDVTFPEASLSFPVWYTINLQPGEFNVVSSNAFTMNLYKECGDVQALAETSYDEVATKHKLHYTVTTAGTYILKLEASNANTTANVSGSALITGIEEVADYGYSVRVEKNAIIVTPATQQLMIEIYDIAGKKMEVQSISSSTSFAVPSGFYIVKAGNHTQKIIVKD